MRTLSDQERAYVQRIFEQKAKGVNRIMWVFRVFGILLILAILMYIISGNAPKSDIPFMLIGCVILYLVFFKFAGFVANKNQWKLLLKALKEKKETVYDCELVDTYKTSHGDSSGAKEFMATVVVNGKTLRGNADSALRNAEPGTSVVLISAFKEIEYAFKYIIPNRNRVG